MEIFKRCAFTHVKYAQKCIKTQRKIKTKFWKYDISVYTSRLKRLKRIWHWKHMDPCLLKIRHDTPNIFTIENQGIVLQYSRKIENFIRFFIKQNFHHKTVHISTEHCCMNRFVRQHMLWKVLSYSNILHKGVIQKAFAFRNKSLDAPDWRLMESDLLTIETSICAEWPTRNGRVLHPECSRCSLRIWKVELHPLHSRVCCPEKPWFSMCKNFLGLNN